MKMKKLLVLLLSLLISFNSYAYGRWEEVINFSYSNDYPISLQGSTMYIDIDTAKKHDGYVYYWTLTDYARAIDIKFDDHSGSIMSDTTYWQGDCAVSRLKMLSSYFYDQPMNKGKSVQVDVLDNWVYPPPGSWGAIILDVACDYERFYAKKALLEYIAAQE